MHSNWRGSQEWRKSGLPLTTGSEEACKLYDAIVTQYMGWYDDDSLGGMEGTFAKLAQADPNFVMGQVVANGMEAMGTGRSIHLDPSFKADIARMVKLASDQGQNLTEREKKHVAAVELFTQGHPVKAAEHWEEVLVSHPTDTLALKFAHDCYFYLGDSVQIRDSVARVLPHWKEDTPLYGYILGMHAFGLEETNLYTEAEASANKALGINPRDAWSTHTLCHVMEMTGRQEEGIKMMGDTDNYWTTCAMLACHNYWHWALYHIELGDYESALSIFDNNMSERVIQSGGMLDIVDGASLLYRLELEGVNVGNRWDIMYGCCKNHLHDHILSFNDVHILLACLGADKNDAVQELMDSLTTFVKEGQGNNREISAEVGQALCQAFLAYKAGEFAKAVDLVAPIRYKIIKIGGSHAQRDIFNLFLIQAAIKSPEKRHHKLARSLLNERKVLKPNAPMTDRLMAKAIEMHAD